MRISDRSSDVCSSDLAPTGADAGDVTGAVARSSNRQGTPPDPRKPPMKNDNTIRYPQLLPDVFQALGKINPAIDSAGLERSLHHLVVLRASQVNGCAHCVKLHTREARPDGETNARLDRLVRSEVRGGGDELVVRCTSLGVT